MFFIQASDSFIKPKVRLFSSFTITSITVNSDEADFLICNDNYLYSLQFRLWFLKFVSVFTCSAETLLLCEAWYKCIRKTCQLDALIQCHRSVYVIPVFVCESPLYLSVCVCIWVCLPVCGYVSLVSMLMCKCVCVCVCECVCVVRL